MNIKVLGTLSISEKSTGVTSSAGTASSLSKVVEYQVPAAGYGVMIDADTVVMIKDSGTTETGDGRQVQIKAVKADNFATQVIEDTQYGLIKRQQDQRIQHHPIQAGDKVIVQPFGLIQVWINTDQAYSATTSNFTLIAKKVQVTP